MSNDEYPDWFTALDRALIQQAWDTHGPPPHYHDSVRPAHGPTLVFISPSYGYESDADARTALLAQLTVVDNVLDGHPDHAADWPATARRLRDALIVKVDRYRKKDTWPTLDAFAAAIDQALAEKTEPQEPAAPRYPHQAATLAEWMRRAGITTPRQLEKLGGPDHKTGQKILDGFGSTRDDVWQKIVTVLNEKHCPVSIADIPPD